MRKLAVAVGLAIVATVDIGFAVMLTVEPFTLRYSTVALPTIAAQGSLAIVLLLAGIYSMLVASWVREALR